MNKVDAVFAVLVCLTLLGILCVTLYSVGHARGYYHGITVQELSYKERECLLSPGEAVFYENRHWSMRDTVAPVVPFRP